MQFSGCALGQHANPCVFADKSVAEVCAEEDRLSVVAKVLQGLCEHRVSSTLPDNSPDNYPDNCFDNMHVYSWENTFSRKFSTLRDSLC